MHPTDYSRSEHILAKTNTPALAIVQAAQRAVAQALEADYSPDPILPAGIRGSSPSRPPPRNAMVP